MTRLAVACLLLLLASGCGSSCENEVVLRIPSSNGLHEAILFERNCGATTGFSTQIAVEAVGRAPSFSGTVFVADDNNGSAQAAAWGGPWATMRWVTPTELLIRYDVRSAVFRLEEAVENVRIRYEPVDR
jgi:hypothetical protein